MPEPETVRECRTCSIEKPIESFNRDRAKRGGRSPHCRSCHAEKYGNASLERAYAQRDRIAEIKLAAGCIDCGYNESALALEFDHIPERGPKSIGIAVLATGCSWERIEAEMALCEIVCSNCHAIRTGSRRTRRTFDHIGQEAA